MKTENPANEALVITQFLMGDEKAFHTLYKRYHQPVFNNILSIIKDNFYSEDILQEVFLTLWEKRNSLRNPENIGGWLFVTSTNKSLNYLRHMLKTRFKMQSLDLVQEIAYVSDDGGKTTMVGLFDEMQVVPGEQELMDAFSLLSLPKPHVAFVTGHNERVAADGGSKDRDYNMRLNNSQERRSIVNHGFDFRQINVDSQEIPKDISLLIIADPRLPLKPAELAKIQKYIADGGDLMINGESDRKALIDPIINPLGVRFMDGALFMDSTYEDVSPDYVANHFAPEASGYSRVLKHLYNDSAVLTSFGESGLLYDTNGPFKIEPFIITDKRTTWNRTVPVDSGAKRIIYNPAQGDKKGVYPIALTLQREIKGKQQRIMVFGDADMLSDANFDFVPKKKVWDMTEEIFKWFTEGNFPQDIYHSNLPDTRLTMSKVGASVAKSIFLFILPAILFAMGSLLLLKRARR